ncbi:unnamed protein product [Ixodes persulcatus]
MKVHSGDEVLREHIESGPGNATYLSPQIQNEIIAASGRIIQDTIVNQVNNAKCFTLLADETTDISGKEQMSVCVRYLQDGSLREDFLEFVEVDNLSGRSLASLLMGVLRERGVDTTYLCGQGYDGAANMAGRLNGVQATQAVIQEKHPAALYTHCSSHCLNLALCDSCALPDIRNAVGTVREVCTFFRKSAHRTAVLKRIIAQNHSGSRKERLHAFCETRWVERHEAIQTFVEFFPAVIAALETLQDKGNAETATKAHQLLTCVLTSSFIVTIVICGKLLSLPLQLSRQLQCPTADLVQAIAHIDDVEASVMQLRESGLPALLQTAQQLCEEVNLEKEIPRARQRQMNNIPSCTVEDYFRVFVYLPFLDHFRAQLSERFRRQKGTIKLLSAFLPQNIAQAEKDIDIDQIVTLYGGLVSFSELPGEVVIWAQKWRSGPIQPVSAVQATCLCPSALYPNIYRLLQILATMPVSTAEAERSFSTLRRLKSYLRASTSQQRLLGLALLNVHRDVHVSPERVLSLLSIDRRRLRLNV